MHIRKFWEEHYPSIIVICISVVFFTVLFFTMHVALIHASERNARIEANYKNNIKSQLPNLNIQEVLISYDRAEVLHKEDGEQKIWVCVRVENDYRC